MNEASPRKKTFVLISVIIGLVCTLVVLLGMWSIIDGSVLDIPLVRMIAPADELEVAKEGLEEYIDRYEDLSDSYIEEFEDEYDMDMDKVIRFYEKPSLNGFIAFANLPELDMPEDALMALNVVRVIVVVYSLIIAVFTLLAAVLRKKAFSIVALCVGLLFFALLANVVWTIFFLLLCVAHIVFISMANNA